MVEYAGFRRGGTTFPLPTGTGLSLLRHADPFVFYALEFYKKVLETHLGAALLEAATGTPVTSTVASVSSVNPIPYLAGGTFTYPLLAVYRVRGAGKERTVGWRHDEDLFEVLYLLPPLTATDAVALGAVTRAVVATLDDRTANGFDPTHTPTGGALGGEVWARAGTEGVTITEHDYGFIDGLAAQPLYGVRLRGRVRDREDKVLDDFDDFEGSSVDVDLVDRSGSRLLVAQLATEGAPTIASLDVVSGPVAGGTLVTVTGTGFKAPLSGTLGSLPLVAPAIVSATSLTFETPAQLPSVVGTAVDLEIECNGQSALAAGAFTYTA